MAVEIDTVTGLLAAQVEADGDAPALIYGGTVMSFAQWQLASRRVASGLEALGIGAGDRVAFWLPNTPAYLIGYLACCRLGAIATAVNTRFRAHEVADIVARSGARVMLLWPGFRGIDFLAILGAIEADALAGLETVVLYDEGDPAQALPDAIAHCRALTWAELADHEAMAEDRAQGSGGVNIFTTSGTTKAPKFVLHSNRSIALHAPDVAASLAVATGDKATLLALPLCGVFGFTQAMAALAGGCPQVLMSAFDAGEAVRLIDEHDIGYLNGTDDMIEALLAADPREMALPSVRFCGFGSFNTDPEICIERAEARGLTLVGLYGMSEVQALFSRQPENAPREERMLGGGVLINETSAVRCRDVETGRILPHGKQGELEFRGPSLMAEYFLSPEDTAEGFTEDGFIRSGDMGYTVAERRFVYLARMGDVLRLGGFLVSPVEIEVFIQEVDGIAGCQVVGVSQGERARAVAFVTLAAGAAFDEQAVIGHCLSGMAKFKAPVRVLALDEFPTTRSANGTKIQRAKLRQWAQDQIEADG